MSRTYKDRPVRIKYPDEHWKTSGEYESVPYIASGNHWATNEPYERLAWFMVKKPYLKRKKRKEQDTEWHWLQSTPSWWTKIFMNRPLRRQAQRWSRDVSKINNWEELEEVDKPNVSKKPHCYYW